MPLATLEPPVDHSDARAHEPVAVDRITQLLAVEQGPALLIDATLGAAGHAAALLAASAADVHLLGFDRDPDALELAGRRLAAYGGRVTLVHAPYDELADRAAALTAQVGPVAAVLYDLGVSSMQLDRADRGFSFRADAPLDMRMDPTTGQTAADMLAEIDVAELTQILRTYGEERFAGRLAAAIVAARPTTTAGLVAAVLGATPERLHHTTPHPATRTFQALRIAVNGELDRFGASLPQALELVGRSPVAGRGGRIAVLSYHSLEDRIAKRMFADAAMGCICPPEMPVCGCGRTPEVRVLTRGAERPSDSEIAANPRARSAKLRVVEALPQVVA